MAIRSIRCAALLTAACAAPPPALAQSETTPVTTSSLPAVTVSSRAENTLSIGGWGGLPLEQTPLPASVYDATTLKDYDIQRLSDLTRLDPAISDAYNAIGYWDSITLRGFVIDNRFNYRRDGLPINAETSIPLDNKQRIEVLKGVTGMQAGSSSPGGIVNFVVKRPTEAPLNEAFVQWQSQATWLASADLSQRLGDDKAVGLRINAAAERLRPDVNDADGQRWLIAVAGDWRLGRDSLLEAEFESSRRSQPSVPAMSLLGDTLPSPAKPPMNLNNQDWSQPVVFSANTASIRFTQAIDTDWRWRAQLAGQWLNNDDRIAFPFGCSAEGNYDRYCSDGSFDLYDYRSDNERRNTGAFELTLDGRVAYAGATHALSLGALGTRFSSRFERQAFNFVGSGTIDGTTPLPADPTLTTENTNRDERSIELFARDAVQIGDRFTLWLALRNTWLQRQSVATDGSAATDYRQSTFTPWLAASWRLDDAQMLYASWGEGAESDVVPNREQYLNAGQALPSIKSRQFEIGLKGARDNLTWSVAAFDIKRPVYADVPINCDDATGVCTLQRQADGGARHSGLEAGGTARFGPWWLGGGLQWLQARRSGSQDAAVNGLRPVNVPAWQAKAQVQYTPSTLPTLTLGADLAAEGDRTMFPDNDQPRIPAYAIVGLTGQWLQRLGGGTSLLWRAGIDNLLDRQGWKEGPYQFGHVYLFPIPGRSGRLSVDVQW